jgi:hypothetical protein
VRVITTGSITRPQTSGGHMNTRTIAVLALVIAVILVLVLFVF